LNNKFLMPDLIIFVKQVLKNSPGTSHHQTLCYADYLIRLNIIIQKYFIKITTILTLFIHKIIPVQYSKCSINGRAAALEK